MFTLKTNQIVLFKRPGVCRGNHHFMWLLLTTFDWRSCHSNEAIDCHAYSVFVRQQKIMRIRNFIWMATMISSP